MRKLAATLVAVLSLCLLALGGSGAFGSALGGTGVATCTGGVIAPGTYASLLVTGKCSIPAGTVVLTGSVVVASNATLNASSPATVIIGGNVIVSSGATFGLGCSTDNPECVGLPLTDRIDGSLTASSALMVTVWGTTVGGNITLTGGGGGAVCPPFFIFSDLTNNTVRGNVAVTGLNSCWFGMFRNSIGGNVAVTGNVFGDDDATEIGTNVIGGNLVCFGNSPAAQFGDSGALPNTVRGIRAGECSAL